MMRKTAAVFLLSAISASAMAQAFDKAVRDPQSGLGANDAPSRAYTRVSPGLTIGELRKGHVSVYKTEMPFTSIQIGDPRIVDVTASSDRTVSVLALDQGSTNVLFLDDKGEVALELELKVAEPKVAPPPPPPPPTGRLITVYERVVTFYRCGPDFCDYHGEKTAPMEQAGR